MMYKRKIFLKRVLIFILMLLITILTCFGSGMKNAQSVDLSYKNKLCSDDTKMLKDCDNKNKKVVFLTFDDGPSYNNTNKILNILEKNNIKATFFVIGNSLQKYPSTVQRMKKFSMDIYPHCYKHNYKEIYLSEKTYKSDYLKCINVIEDMTSCNYRDLKRKFLRIPGGSDNLVSNQNVLKNIRNNLNSENIDYVDWNVSSGDAVCYKAPKEALVNNVKRNGNVFKISVVLFHDAENKTTTTEALPDVIEYYKSNGYEFKKLSEMTDYEYNYLIRNRVINRK